MAIEAKFRGICSICDLGIWPGQMIQETEGEWSHVYCLTEQLRDAKRETCPKCWLVKPCDCD